MTTKDTTKDAPAHEPVPTKPTKPQKPSWFDAELDNENDYAEEENLC